MEWMVVHLTRRNIAVAVTVLMLTPLAISRAKWAVRVIGIKLRPSQSVPAQPPPPDLKTQLTRQEMRGIVSRYRRVSAMLDKAEAQGFSVAGHRAKAKASLRMAQLGYRWQAQSVLNQVEMSIPRQKVRYIPVYPQEETDEEVAPDAKGTSTVGQKPKTAAAPKAKPKAKAKPKRRR